MSGHNPQAGEPPARGLLGYWPGDISPGGRVRDHSPEENHGIYGRDARWVWFTNPRAVRHVGDHDRTYVGYVGGPTGRDVCVGVYDHDTGSFETTVVEPDVSRNDHTTPAVLARNDGHLLVCWSRHDGESMRSLVSTDPEDISTFETTATHEGAAVCYPNPIQIGTDRGSPIYLFYRDRAGTGDGHVYYRRSEDGGHSWSEDERLVTAPAGHFSVYFVAAERNGCIHLFFTDAEGGSTTPKRHVLYGRLEDNTFFEADGSVIAAETQVPLSTDDLEVVYDSTAPDNHFCWIWDAGVDEGGNPAVVYATFPSSLAHEYRYARWTGERWVDRFLIDAGEYLGADAATRYYSGGIAIDERDPDTVYASVRRGGRFVLKRLETDNLGRTFAADTITDRAAGDHMRPVVPSNATEEVPVLWNAGAYNNFDSSQTTLQGVPVDPPATGCLAGHGERGVSLGIDLYGAGAFDAGLSVSLAFETTDPSAEQTLADFGGGIELAVGDPNELRFSLADGAGASTTVAWDGVAADTEYFVEGAWDGRNELTLFVEDTVEETARFEGPVGFDADRRGWTLMKRSLLEDAGLRGRLRSVRLYNRPLSDTERARLASSVAARG